MIKAHITRTHAGIIQDITITGHAGQGPYGFDIVCAAVSALSETLVLGLTHVAPVAMDYHLDEGNLTMALKELPSERTEALLETFCLGLRDLALSEPKFVKYDEIVVNRHSPRGR
ncbi:MAG: ribosomal-processing cysteine protease Prp [Firmicutes bacterium]|uniref:Ribosomal processing cysteine protease Prp n=1 Tax=Sulfobacillus benefaciens TaxID=453960 RepID=A0A2T2WZS5_9FIRM|nr:ribosomal-processing cysteine protease Prp [Bacillota bacterium]PSR27740.1 MAG: ribosomal-processing cysteine protease Prp [Sulfobacillus benefaciens]HBQ94181.1 ribosomal-processing cysteine protease Prp [Sulfobacillus sp.]